MHRNILIVDDEPYNLMGLQILIKLSFSNLGFKEHYIEDLIHEATNGQDAVDKVEMNLINNKSSYGIIFMDCSMPIMNGYDASVAIRKYYKKHKVNQPMIVACTGHTESGYILKAWRHAIDEVIPKPANINVISQIL